MGDHQTPLGTLIWADDILWIRTQQAIKEAKEELGKQFPLKSYMYYTVRQDVLSQM